MVWCIYRACSSAALVCDLAVAWLACRWRQTTSPPRDGVYRKQPRPASSGPWHQSQPGPAAARRRWMSPISSYASLRAKPRAAPHHQPHQQRLCGLRAAAQSGRRSCSGAQHIGIAGAQPVERAHAQSCAGSTGGAGRGGELPKRRSPSGLAGSGGGLPALGQTGQGHAVHRGSSGRPTCSASRAAISRL